MPPEAVNARCRTYLRGQDKPLIRNDLIRTSDYNIVATFGSEYRGYVQYYQLAGNINWLNKLRSAMEPVDDVNIGRQTPTPTLGHAESLPDHRRHLARKAPVL